MMNVHDAAEQAANDAEQAIERMNAHGHGQRENVVHAVIRASLEAHVDDDERRAEAQGIALRRVQRGHNAVVQ